MFASSLYTLVLLAGLSSAFPLHPRLVTLDPAATAEAQPRDDTATRAFTATSIKVRASPRHVSRTHILNACIGQTSDGQCLFVVSGSGDFRNNLTPVQVGPCDNSAGQQVRLRAALYLPLVLTDVVL